MNTSLLDISDIIDRFRGPLVGLLISWGTPHTDAHDLAQDCIADAYLGRDACRGDWQDAEVFGRWLRGYAKNRFRNFNRSRLRRRQRMETVSPESLQELEDPSAREDGLRLQELRDAIMALPERQRTVILMHYLEETSVNQVAELLSVSPKAVEGRLYQARKALKRSLLSSELPLRKLLVLL